MSATSGAICLGVLCVLALTWTGVCSQNVEDNAKVARISFYVQINGTKTPETTAKNLQRERPAPEDLQRERPAPEDLKEETEQFFRGFYDPTEERNELQSSYINLAKQRDQLMIRYNNLIKERIQLQTVCNIVSYIREKNQFQSRLNNLTRERDQIQTSYNNVTQDRDQLQTRYNNLTTEQYQLQTSYNNLIQERDQLRDNNYFFTRERDQLQSSYDNLTKERDQLQTSYNNLVNDKNQLQTSYNNLTKDKNQLQTSYNTATTRITELQKEVERLAPLARSCPVGWGKFGSSCYLISYGSKTWQESSNDCAAKGARLVIINSREEQAFVSAQTNNQRVWIGLYDPYGNRNFRWVDGSSLTTGYWASGEPNNYGGTPENCVEIRVFEESLNGWNDESCSFQSNWVCEL